MGNSQAFVIHETIKNAHSVLDYSTKKFLSPKVYRVTCYKQGLSTQNKCERLIERACWVLNPVLKCIDFYNILRNSE